MYNYLFPSSKYTYVDVLASYFVMHMMAHSCTRRGLLKNHAHWCMVIDISGPAGPIMYPNIPTSAF